MFDVVYELEQGFFIRLFNQISTSDLCMEQVFYVSGPGIHLYTWFGLRCIIRAGTSVLHSIIYSISASDVRVEQVFCVPVLGVYILYTWFSVRCIIRAKSSVFIRSFTFQSTILNRSRSIGEAGVVHLLFLTKIIRAATCLSWIGCSSYIV